MEDGTSWQKSTFSGTGNCVEVRIGPEGVEVRSTKNRSGQRLQFTLPEWHAFVLGVRAGEFDLVEGESLEPS